MSMGINTSLSYPNSLVSLPLHQPLFLRLRESQFAFSSKSRSPILCSLRGSFELVSPSRIEHEKQSPRTGFDFFILVKQLRGFPELSAQLHCYTIPSFLLGAWRVAVCLYFYALANLAIQIEYCCSFIVLHQHSN
ncbi:hypothetical protein K1719_012781 [Acacia pycnantha]|nr:hypothetical protein K1719_012781 [Acacia pycnantha]